MELHKPYDNMRVLIGKRNSNPSPLPAQVILDENDCNCGFTNLRNAMQDTGGRAKVFIQVGFVAGDKYNCGDELPLEGTIFSASLL